MTLSPELQEAWEYVQRVYELDPATTKRVERVLKRPELLQHLTREYQHADT